MYRVALFLLAACSQGVPVDPPTCDAGTIALDARVDAEGVGLPDAEEAHVGIPPQGGAPYTAFGIVVSGELGADTVLQVTGDVRDAGGTILGTVEQNTSVICANAGPWAGRWYGGEAHIRYWGLGLQALDGLAVTARLTVGRQGVPLATTEGAFTLVSSGGGDTFLVGEASP
jgi:hypothetical protein